MDVVQAKLAELRARVMGAFAADPRKCWALTVLLAILLVVVARLASKAPAVRQARAAAHAAPLAVAGEIPTPDFSSGPKIPLSQWARQQVEPIGRNLFCIPLDYYPYPDGNHSADTSDGMWDQLAHSMSVQSDARRQHEVLVDNLRAQAEALKLQGTVLGAVPKAWINGSLFQLGQRIGATGFRLMEIDSRSIIVEQDGIRLVIEMN